MDNNSRDESFEIAAQYAGQDPRINLISESRQGIVPALNTGIEHASGKYIARMDADDISYSKRLEYQYDFLEKNPKVDLVACAVNYVGDEGANYGFLEYVKWNNRLLSHDDIALNRFVESPLVHPTVMFRKYIVEKFGGYREGDFPEDYELWLRLLHHGVKMYKLKDVLLDWNDSDIRLTRTDEPV